MYSGAIEDNKETLDVLFCISQGHARVDDISGKLKQKRSTVSMKLAYLKRHKIVTLNGRVYMINWSVFGSLLERIVKDFFTAHKYHGLAKNVKDYFPESRLKNIFEWYAKYVLEGEVEKNTLRHMFKDYFLGLFLTDDKTLKRLDKDIVQLKRLMLR